MTTPSSSTLFTAKDYVAVRNLRRPIWEYMFSNMSVRVSEDEHNAICVWYANTHGKLDCESTLFLRSCAIIKEEGKFGKLRVRELDSWERKASIWRKVT